MFVSTTSICTPIGQAEARTMIRSLKVRLQRLEQRAGAHLDELPPFVVECVGQFTATFRLQNGLPTEEWRFHDQTAA